MPPSWERVEARDPRTDHTCATIRTRGTIHMCTCAAHGACMQARASHLGPHSASLLRRTSKGGQNVLDSAVCATVQLRAHALQKWVTCCGDQRMALSVRKECACERAWACIDVALQMTCAGGKGHGDGSLFTLHKGSVSITCIPGAPPYIPSAAAPLHRPRRFIDHAPELHALHRNVVHEDLDAAPYCRRGALPA